MWIQDKSEMLINSHHIMLLNFHHTYKHDKLFIQSLFHIVSLSHSLILSLSPEGAQQIGGVLLRMQKLIIPSHVIHLTFKHFVKSRIFQ